MRGLAFGLLGISRREFYGMRPGEFWEAVRAYKERVNADRRHLGELVRGATLRLFNLQVDKRYRMKDPAKFWPMPWDDAADAEDQEIRRLAHLGKEETQKEVEKFFNRVGNHGKRGTKSKGKRRG